MQTPTYFDREKNGIAIYGNVTGLTDMIFYDKMTLVGCLPTKGGRCDNNGGISDSQGGGNRTESLCRNGQTHVSPRRTACNQGQWSVAHLQRSVRGEKTTGTVCAVSGKLNSSSVAGCDSVTIGTRHQTAVGPCYRHAYYTRDWCHMATRADGRWAVVEREWKSMTAVSTRIHLFNADGQEVGNISATTFSALIESGLLDREGTPVENLAPIHGPCIECGRLLCSRCFGHDGTITGPELKQYHVCDECVDAYTGLREIEIDAILELRAKLGGAK